MTRPSDKRLDDLLAIADEVASIVARGKHNFDDDLALRRALERCSRSSSKPPNPSMMNFRNQQPSAPPPR